MRFAPSRSLARVAVVIGLATHCAARASDVPLRTDPDSYFVLGMRSVQLKNLKLEVPGCNLGANCLGLYPLVQCGQLTAADASVPAPGQVAAATICGAGSYYQAFRNNDGATCRPSCADVAHPGSQVDCTDPFVGPILADLDQDGNPSCSATCTIDDDDLAAACGVTLPLPACDPLKTVAVQNDADCPGPDLVPGNFRCDLPAGTYGTIRVATGARLVFAPGTTVLCNLYADRYARVTSAGPATVLLPGSGTVRLNTGGDHGTGCGMLKFVNDRGTLQLGKLGDVRLDACSINGSVNLGHSNVLLGHYFGDRVAANLNNVGRCCSGSVVTTSTTLATTTTTAPGSTSTTAPSSTTTTAPGSTSTTAPSSTTTTAPGSTSTTAPSSTTTTAPGSTSTTTTSASSSTTQQSTSSTTVTSTTSASTTTTTQPAGAFTRTPGFWKTHPAVTAAVLSSVGGLSVCGTSITTVGVSDVHSALEAMCVTPQGNRRLQLIRQLTAAALNGAAGGAQFAGFAACDAVCRSATATDQQIDACIGSADTFNNSGDAVVAPFEPAGAANPKPCKQAQSSACTLLSTERCSIR